jgi:hypothetical protein
MATNAKRREAMGLSLQKVSRQARALLDCLPQLFHNGVLSSERVADYRRLNTEVEEVRKRMDELINSNST